LTARPGTDADVLRLLEAARLRRNIKKAYTPSEAVTTYAARPQATPLSTTVDGGIVARVLAASVQQAHLAGKADVSLAAARLHDAYVRLKRTEAAEAAPPSNGVPGENQGTATPGRDAANGAPPGGGRTTRRS
jgi:hypothetical protein